MKRNDLMVWLLLGDTLVFPLLVGLAKLFGYTLRVGGGLIYALAATALYVFCAVRLMISRDRRLSAAPKAVLGVMLLLTQLHVLIFTLYVYSADAKPAMLLLALWYVITAVLAVVYVESAALKAVFFTLSGLLVLPVCLLFVLSGFRMDRVEAFSVSPAGTYRAEVVEHDEGALGGNVNVQVYRGSFSIGSFDFLRDQKEIYHGAWGSSRVLHWLDDEHLIYDEREYFLPEIYE